MVAVGPNSIHALIESGRAFEVRDQLLRRPEWLECRNEFDATPLMVAIAHERVVIAAYLLLRGADPDAGIQYGDNCLTIAAARDSDAALQLIGLLLVAGADIHGFDSSGMTALHVAASCGNVRVLRLLLARGADVDVRDAIHGATPLIVAACSGRAEGVRVLLEAGADPHARDFIQRHTALESARAMWRPSRIARFFNSLEVNDEVLRILFPDAKRRQAFEQAMRQSTQASDWMQALHEMKQQRRARADYRAVIRLLEQHEPRRR